LRKYLSEIYGRVFQRYMQLVAAAALRRNCLWPAELFLAGHFSLLAVRLSPSVPASGPAAIAESGASEVHTAI